jgi:hypothetical protein
MSYVTHEAGAMCAAGHALETAVHAKASAETPLPITKSQNWMHTCPMLTLIYAEANRPGSSIVSILFIKLFVRVDLVATSSHVDCAQRGHFKHFKCLVT